MTLNPLGAAAALGLSLRPAASCGVYRQLKTPQRRMQELPQQAASIVFEAAKHQKSQDKKELVFIHQLLILKASSHCRWIVIASLARLAQPSNPLRRPCPERRRTRTHQRAGVYVHPNRVEKINEKKAAEGCDTPMIACRHYDCMQILRLHADIMIARRYYEGEAGTCRALVRMRVPRPLKKRPERPSFPTTSFTVAKYVKGI